MSFNLATGKMSLSRNFFYRILIATIRNKESPMSCGSYLTNQFHERGFRMTPQRMAILHTLRHAGGHLSPTEVYERTRRVQPGLTETTVYRTLEFLAENGFALAAHVGSGRLVYELSEENHHHLICKKCGGTVAVDYAALKPLYDKLSSTTGYQLDASHVTLFGLCPQCQSSS
jgi:Fur family transcriptional regulator, ferric uptake regulator